MKPLKLLILTLLIWTAFPTFVLAKSHALADQYWEQATTFKNKNELLEAAQYYEKAAEAEAASPNPRKGALKSQLGWAALCYKIKSKLDKALKLYLWQKEVIGENGKQEAIADNFYDLGKVYLGKRQYDMALTHAQQSLKINQRLKRENWIANNLMVIADIYLYKNKYHKSVSLLEESLKINRKGKIKFKLQNNLARLAHAYYEVGQYGLAEKHFLEALSMAKNGSGDTGYIATYVNGLAKVYDSWGQTEKALSYYQQSLAIRLEKGDRSSASSVLSNIANIYSDMKLYEKALELYQETFSYDEALIYEETNGATRISKSTISTSTRIADMYLYMGNTDKALKQYQHSLKSAREIDYKTGISFSQQGIAIIYQQSNRYDEAIALKRNSLSILREQGSPAQIANALGALGLSYMYIDQYDKAIEFFHESIELKEAMRSTATGETRRDYLASQFITYENLINAYVKKNDPDGALRAIDQSRARLLVENIVQNDIEMSSPSLEQLQQGLNAGEALLIYSNMSWDQFIVIVVTSKQVTMKKIDKQNYLAKAGGLYSPSILKILDAETQQFSDEADEQTHEFDKSINYYRLLLTDLAHANNRGLRSIKAKQHSKDHTKDFSSALYDLLISSIAKELKGIEQITIMPDGILNFLPFETLIDNQGQYLIADFDIKYNQSMSTIDLIKKRKYSEKRKAMLAIGGAVYNELAYETEMRQPVRAEDIRNEVDVSMSNSRSMRGVYETIGMAQWGNLPGTLSEVNDISIIVKNAELLTGKNVTEEAIKTLSKDGKLDDYKVLHFATHGMVVPTVPSLSAVILSQFKEEGLAEDGYLRMAEISALNLKADFVNLSACETGLGKIYQGEGVVGLAQSFIIAGANGLSVSLWQVADDSTSKFMTEVYKLKEDQNISYSQAITRVKRRFINGEFGKQWSSPYYWSPFVYYGK